MQPQTNDQYQPKWRHFHPQATVWVLNPFEHDVIFNVADEDGRQSQFRIQARQRAELPGGAVATLGLKTIVDEMIQNSKEDLLSLYVTSVRTKYEEKVILRIKEAPASLMADGQSGPIDLSMTDGKAKKEEEKPKEEVKPFSDLPENPQYVEEKPKKNPIPVNFQKKTQVVESD